MLLYPKTPSVKGVCDGVLPLVMCHLGEVVMRVCVCTRVCVTVRFVGPDEQHSREQANPSTLSCPVKRLRGVLFLLFL